MVTDFEAALVASTEVAQRIRQAVAGFDEHIVMLALADVQGEIVTDMIDEMLRD